MARGVFLEGDRKRKEEKEIGKGRGKKDFRIKIND